MATSTPTPTPTPTPTTSLLYPVIKNTYELESPPDLDQLELIETTRMVRPENFSGQVGIISCYVLGNPEPTPSPSNFRDMFVSWYKTHESSSLSLSFEGVESSVVYCSLPASLETV